jgi:hypothetical protein
MVQKSGAGFIETMDCLPVSKLPEGREWTYELKLDWVPAGGSPPAPRGNRPEGIYSKGAVSKILVNRFERDPKARAASISIMALNVWSAGSTSSHASVLWERYSSTSITSSRWRRCG